MGWPLAPLFWRSVTTKLQTSQSIFPMLLTLTKCCPEAPLPHTRARAHTNTRTHTHTHSLTLRGSKGPPPHAPDFHQPFSMASLHVSCGFTQLGKQGLRVGHRCTSGNTLQMSLWASRCSTANIRCFSLSSSSARRLLSSVLTQRCLSN